MGNLLVLDSSGEEGTSVLSSETYTVQPYSQLVIASLQEDGLSRFG